MEKIGGGYAEDLNKRTIEAQTKIKAGGKEALEAHFDLNKLSEEAENVRGEAEKELGIRNEGAIATKESPGDAIASASNLADLAEVFSAKGAYPVGSPEGADFFHEQDVVYTAFELSKMVNAAERFVDHMGAGTIKPPEGQEWNKENITALINDFISNQQTPIPENFGFKAKVRELLLKSFYATQD